jgi:hypothetical protein
VIIDGADEEVDGGDDDVDDDDDEVPLVLDDEEAEADRVKS